MLREREAPRLRYSGSVGALTRLVNSGMSEGLVDNASWIRTFGSRSWLEQTSPGANSLSIRTCGVQSCPELVSPGATSLSIKIFSTQSTCLDCA